MARHVIVHEAHVIRDAGHGWVLAEGILEDPVTEELDVVWFRLSRTHAAELVADGPSTLSIPATSILGHTEVA